MPVMEIAEQKLKRPFPVSKLKWRKGHGGSGDLVYIDARDVMTRLDEVCGPDLWQNKFDFIGGRMICTIYIWSNTLKEWIAKSDGADDSQIEGAKGGCSDSFKRAAVHWGVARYLYYKGAFDENRKPAPWATPEGYDEIMDKRSLTEVVTNVKK